MDKTDNHGYLNLNVRSSLIAMTMAQNSRIHSLKHYNHYHEWSCDVYIPHYIIAWPDSEHLDIATIGNDYNDLIASPQAWECIVVRVQVLIVAIP